MKRTITLIVVVVTVGIGWKLGSPLFLNKEINEDFPIENYTDNLPVQEKISLEKFDEMLAMPSDTEMNKMDADEMRLAEEKMREKAATLPAVVVMEKMEDQKMETQTTEGEKTLSRQPDNQKMEVTEPILISQGAFKDADDFHQGSGSAKLFKMPDGSHLIRLENLNVTNGPDLFVYLTNAKGANNSAEVKEGFYNVGRLKGNMGNQNYSIPADVDISNYKGLAIYCKAFSVLFSSTGLN